MFRPHLVMAVISLLTTFTGTRSLSLALAQFIFLGVLIICNSCRETRTVDLLRNTKEISVSINCPRSWSQGIVIVSKCLLRIELAEGLHESKAGVCNLFTSLLLFITVTLVLLLPSALLLDHHHLLDSSLLPQLR